MNSKKLFILLTIAVLFFSGCSRKGRAPVVQPQRDYPVVRPGVTSDSDNRHTIPKHGIITKKNGVYDPVQAVSQEEKKYPISVDFVDKRIQAYGKKLEKWKEYDNQSSVLNLDQQATEQMVGCFRDLQRMINGYSRLRDMLVATENKSLMRKMTLEEIQELQENDILFLESSCGRLLDVEGSVTVFGKSGFGKDPAQLEALIKQSFQNREYEQVVQLWLEIPEERVSQVKIRTKLMYGKSLMFLHQEQKAASVYEQIIADIGQQAKETADVLELHKVLANLYVAARNYSAAADQYRKILEKYQEVLQIKEWTELQQSILKSSRMGGRELNEYSAILRNYMGYIPSQDGYKPVWQAEQFLESYPESPMITNVDLIKSEIYIKAERWFKKMIADVEELQLQGKYKDGLILLETIPEDIIGPEQVQLVQKKVDELRSADEIVQEKLRLEKLQALESSWNQGLALVESGRYDEAITQFRSMLDTDYSNKAAAKIAEVSLLAAKANRQQAARFFIRAAKTKDPEAKKQLLVESHQLLMQIMLKYPETQLVDKVMKNIKRVELEMNKLDPTLVEWSRMAVKQKMMEESTGTQETMEMGNDMSTEGASQLNNRDSGGDEGSLNMSRGRMNR